MPLPCKIGRGDSNNFDEKPLKKDHSIRDYALQSLCLMPQPAASTAWYLLDFGTVRFHQDEDEVSDIAGALGQELAGSA